MIIIPLFLGFNHPRWCRISSINSINYQSQSYMQEWCSCGSAPGYGIQFVCDQEYPWLLVQEWNQLQLGLQAIDQEGHPGIHKALPLENTDKKHVPLKESGTPRVKMRYYPPWNKHSLWKLVVGRQLSYCQGPFSRAMFFFGGRVTFKDVFQ